MRALAFNLQLVFSIMLHKISKRVVKYVLSHMTKEERTMRLVFKGKRLLIRQYNWLYFNKHPWEVV